MTEGGSGKTARVGGLAGWLLRRLRSWSRAGGRSVPRLELLERIALAPRQSLALVEAEGRRFLVATSPEGAPAFYALDGRAGQNMIRARARVAAKVAERVSW